MSFHRLRALLDDLGSDLDVDITPLDVAETLWLALHVPAPAGVPAAATVTPPPVERTGASLDPAAGTDTEYFPLHLQEVTSGTNPVSGRPVRARSVSAVPNPLELSRALRPLKRRIASRHEYELDEELTAHQVAASGIWLPALVPTKGRWWDLVLVIDADPGMAVWGTLAAELVTLFQRLGAFRDVRVRYLQRSGAVSTTAEAGLGADRRRWRTPDELVDTTGRRVILVLSDCVGAAWHEHRAQRVLADWAGFGPVAVLQPLPERAWAHTALTPVRGHFESPAPGSAGTRLGFTDYSARRLRPAATATTLPVLEIDRSWLGSWARLVATLGGRSMDGIAEIVAADGHGTPDVPGPVTGLSAQERLARFRSFAPTDVFRLAAYLAAVPTLSLGIMRLVQRAMLPASPPSDLAEIIYSGLLDSVPAGPSGRGDDTQYAYPPDVRTLLRATLRQYEEAEVEWELSRLTQSRIDSAGPSISTVIPTVEPGGPTTAGLGAPATRVSADSLGRLGPLRDLVKPVPGRAARPEPSRPTTAPLVPTPIPVAAPVPVRADRISSDPAGNDRGQSELGGFGGGGYPFMHFSYSHAHWDDLGEQQDADLWVRKFYNNLCTEIDRLTDQPRGQDPIFTDRRIALGPNWSQVLAANLSRCSVFVPLYSRRYFQNPDCGREWSIIRMRQDMHVAATKSAPNIVVPVLWEPVRPQDLPRWARDIQFMHEDLGAAYRTYGLEELIRVKDHETAYRRAVQYLARRIVVVAEQPEQLRPLREVPVFRDLPNEFADHAASASEAGKVRITVVALDTRSKLPPNRSAGWYGSSALDWDPYRNSQDGPGGGTSAVWRASDVARQRNYVTEVTELTTRSEELRANATPTAPTILLVDPWATLDSSRWMLLDRLDKATQHKPWIRIILPWNSTDAETAANANVLYGGIESRLGHARSQGRIPSRRGEPGPVDSSAFGLAVSEALRAALTEFLRQSPKYLPAGPYPSKPRLRGPVGMGAPFTQDDNADPAAPGEAAS